MSKIALISTSTSSLDYLDISDANLRVLRMKILMKDEVFNDYVDITAPDFYARLKQDKTLVPSSTMPAIGELFELRCWCDNERDVFFLWVCLVVFGNEYRESP